MCADGDSETKNEQPLNNQEESSDGAQPALASDEKNAELLQKHTEFHYMNFDRRRSYEWKLSLALWTALAAFTALTLKGEIGIEITSWAIAVGIGAAGIAIVALQLYFLLMILKANSLDKEKSWYYEKALNVLMHTDWETLTDEHSKNLQLKIEKFKSCKVRLSGYWSCLVQIGITVVLLLSALCVLYKKTETEQPSSIVHRVCLTLERQTTVHDK